MVLGEIVMGSDKAAKSVVPSLAVVEKRQPSRPTGGCVGIFFQLFDWHRRFVKKKRFSRKLLPAARPKQALRNFKGDEKMPVAKLHFIADENKGGFPSLRETENTRIERKQEMGAPGLVARLMGLESMPSVHREKARNVLSREIHNDKTSKSVLTNNGVAGEKTNIEKGQLRHERPQKLQKTGACERRAVTRFGAEALQIKGVLSRSRRQNHPTLATPVRSQRISSSRNVSHKSRLIGAAAKILEPGLQTKSRERFALTYSESMHYNHSAVVVVESSTLDHTRNTNSGPVIKKASIFRPMEDQRTEYDDSAGSSSSGFSNASVDNKTTLMAPNVDDGKVFCNRREEESTSPKDGRRLTSYCQEPWRFSSRKSLPQRDEPSSFPTLKSKRASSATSSVSITKDFVACRSLSGQARPRVNSKAESSNTDPIRRSRGRRDDSVSHIKPPVRKVRAVSPNEPARSVNFCNSVSGKQRRVTSTATTGNGKTSEKGGVISFTFNSPIKKNTSSSTEPKDRSVHESDVSRDTLLEGNNKKSSVRDHLAVRGDALGALLEQKLKELTSQEDDDSTGESTKPKRSTAMILQELIAALTTDPTLLKGCDTPDSDNASQVKSRNDGSMIELPGDMNHLSPGSVLDASFSNDSCVSSSLDDSSGHNLLTDLMDASWDLPQQLDPGCDLSASPTSREKSVARMEVIINLISCINRALTELDLPGISLSGTKLSFVKEVFLHSQMLFPGATRSSRFNAEDFIISPTLINELESLATSSWTNSGWFDGLVDLKDDGKQLKEFLFDCSTECLDSKYHPCSNFGYRRWRRLPPGLNDKILIRDVEGWLKMWAGLSGLSVDEMIEWEMGYSLGKWVDFEIEAFENGCEMEMDILQSMVDEIVDDIFLCS